MASDRTVKARVDDRPDGSGSESVDVAEHGRSADGETTSLDRRLFMQLHAYGGARDTASLIAALESAGVVGRPLRGRERSDRCRASHGLGVAGRLRLGVPRLPPVDLRSRSSSRSRSSRCSAGRTRSGYEQDLEDALVERPRRRVLDPALAWAIWYPLRRAGSFEQLSRQRAGHDPHGTRRHRDGVRTCRPRLTTSGSRVTASTATTTTSSSGCSARSCIRSRSSSSGCARRSRRRSISSGSGRSSSGEWRGRAVGSRPGGRRGGARADGGLPARVPGASGRAHARLAPASGGALPACLPRHPRAPLDARGHPHAGARGAGDAPADRLVRPRRRDRLLGHPAAARRHGPRPRLREGRRTADREPDCDVAATSTCSGRLLRTRR